MQNTLNLMTSYANYPHHKSASSQSKPKIIDSKTLKSAQFPNFEQ